MHWILVLIFVQLISFEVSAQLKISWTNNLLTINGAPGGKVDVWYLEAFCRSGAHQRDWGKTVLPHKTTLISNDANRMLRFRTVVQPEVEVMHTIRAGEDALTIDFKLTNNGKEPIDAQWFQPACIRVQNFTGRGQSNYTDRSFIFTDKGLTLLSQTRRTEEALYRGGQVYIPAGILDADANPRPLSKDKPINGLIGCFSVDNRYILATASDQTHELFEGVYVCLHSDPLIGGLRAGETKKLRSKIYFVTNDVPALLARYQKDFPQ